MNYFLLFLALVGLGVSYYRLNQSRKTQFDLLYVLPLWHAFLCLLIFLAVALSDDDHDFSSFSVVFGLLTVVMAMDMEFRFALASSALFLALVSYVTIPSGSSSAMLYVLSAGALIEWLFFMGRLRF